MRYYCFLDTKGEFSPDQLDPIRTDMFALSDEEGVSSWYVPLNNDEEAHLFAKTCQFESFSIVELEDCIDWGMQWSLGQQEGDGKAIESLTIDLKRICETAEEGAFLKLLPGPGFGDLSHPTTRLSLKMLAPLVKDVPFWDIGCGSGILSLAALKLGASKAYGVDIDQGALEHAALNATENNLLERCLFWLPKDGQEMPEESPEIHSEAIVVMNMIRTEQENVWQHFHALSRFRGTLITSGILRTEDTLYKELCKKRGLIVQEECTEGDWMAFRLLVMPAAVVSTMMPTMMSAVVPAMMP